MSVYGSHMFPPFILSSIHGLLSVFRQSTCVCARVCVRVCTRISCMRVCVCQVTICERDSLLHMLHWHPWCREVGVCGGATVYSVWLITCNLLLPPSSPPQYKDPGALSICLKKQVWNLSKNKTIVRPVV